MKIFYCGIQYDKYDQARGPSFEHENFYLTLANMEHVQVRYFPYDDILEKGKEQWNKDLIYAVKEEKPQLVFFFMLSDELDKRTLTEMNTLTTTLAWFADDHWRFDNYSRYWAQHFTWIVTTYSKAVERYRHVGAKNVIRSQWGANAYVYKIAESIPQDNNRPEVVFVGGWSKPRQKIIEAIQRAGIAVEVYGGGWKGGRISEERMIELFGIAKINLAINAAPGYLNKNTLGRLAFRRSIDSIIFDPHIIRNIRTFLHRGIPQIKARQFEIPACRGFTVAGYSDDIEHYYEPDKEMVFYKSTEGLVEKIQYYIEHDAEREEIAKRGYERTLRDHTYEKRFQDIFNQIGL